MNYTQDLAEDTENFAQMKKGWTKIFSTSCFELQKSRSKIEKSFRSKKTSSSFKKNMQNTKEERSVYVLH